MEVPIPGGDSCLRCGDLCDLPGQPHGRAQCRACLLAPPPYERAVSFGLYRGRMRDAIHALKYDRISPAAKPLGRMLARAMAQLHGKAPNELLVVPVPLHRRRYAERGFNQTRLLARHAIAALRRTHPDWKLALVAPRTLIRTRYTESQAGLTPRERRANLRAAFRVSVPHLGSHFGPHSSPKGLRGRHILLVDDILTTGATARSASAELLRAGAESVWVATLARARRNASDLRLYPQLYPQSVNPLTGAHLIDELEEPLESAVFHHPLLDEE
jgi:ComF family protein